MSKNIATQYTKERNKKCGRHGYGMWKHEKVDVISPKDYGVFLQKKIKEGEEMRRLIDFIFPKKKELPTHIKNALQEYEKLCWEG